MVQVTAALNYANRGWAVLPVHGVNNGVCTCGASDCGSPAKHPRTTQGLKDASTNTDQIQEWWTRWPDSNVGIATGPISGIVVVDVDTRENGLENWSDLRDINGNVDTLTATTGSGGTHAVFLLNGESLKNTTSKLAAGIDTRGEGGYIVAPPSIHISGETYRWDDINKNPSYPPIWLVNKWIDTPMKALSPVEAIRDGTHPQWVSQALKGGVSQGQRNETALKLASYFGYKGLPRDIIAEIMETYALKCQPPMDIKELHTVIASAQKFHPLQIGRAHV